jgi:hypothetical protein
VSGGFDPDLDPDLAELCEAVGVTLTDDEPPNDLRLPPHDPTADLPPAARAARVSRRVHRMADTARPTPSESPARDALPIDEASPEAMGEPVGVDTPRAAPAKVSRQKAAGPHEAPWLFGKWTVTSAPPRDAPPPRADAMGEHRTDGVDGHEDLAVF